MAALLGFDFSYFNSQLFVTPSIPPTADFTGQTIIITGSNIGLGLEPARHFVRLNATLVILAVRDVRKGKSAKEDIARTESSYRPDVASCSPYGSWIWRGTSL
jgi:hypothetical protein